MQYKNKTKNELIKELKELKKEQKLNEKKIKKLKEHKAVFIDKSPVGILTCDKNGNIDYINFKAIEILNSPGEEQTKQINILQFPPLKKVGFSENLTKCLQKAETVTSEGKYRSKWGKEIYMRYHIYPLMENNLITGAQIIIDDITVLYKLERELRKGRNYFKSIISTIPDLIILYDKEFNYLDIWTSKPEDLIAPKEELIGKNIKDFLPDNVVKKFKKYSSLAITNDKIGTFEYKLEFDQDIKYFEINLIALDVIGDNENEILTSIRNITKRKKTEEKMKYLSFHDQLTGLYNRRYFENEIKRLNKSRRLPISIVIGDMDGLKYINDNYGHQTGDKYIKKCTEIFCSTTRAEDIVARIGGDEFAVILPETNSISDLKLCRRIQNKCDQFNRNSNLPEKLSISLGFSIMEKEEQDLDNIFDKADKKMYENKEQSRSN